jgi:hypothetical protein
MDYSPPTGIITFPTRAAVQNRQRQGAKSFKLVYDMDVARTVSALTNDDTKSRASSKSRKSARNLANKAAKATASITTSQTVSSEQLAAKVAATQAIAIADAAVTKYPPKAALAHQGAYDTISDAFGYRFPVVRISDKWVPLTADFLRESRKKAPPPNFGLAGKVHGLSSNQSGSTGSTVPATPSVATTTVNAVPTPSAIVATLLADTPVELPTITQQQTTEANAPTVQQQGVVKTKVTAIEARVNATPDNMGTTTESEGPMDIAVENDGNMVIDIDDESTQFGSAASLGTNSCVTNTTLGESSVTWAKVAAHQVYDPAAIPDTVAHNQDAGSVGSVNTNFQSSLNKLHSKSKQQKEKTRRQQSSLAAAAAAGAVIYRPQGSSLAKVAALVKETESSNVPMKAATTAGDNHTLSTAILNKLAKLQDENALLMQMVLRLQKENDSAKDKAKATETMVVATAASGGQSSLARSSQSQPKPPPRTQEFVVTPAAIAGQSSLARLLSAQSVPKMIPPIERIDTVVCLEPEGDWQLTVFQTAAAEIKKNAARIRIRRRAAHPPSTPRRSTTDCEEDSHHELAQRQ